MRVDTLALEDFRNYRRAEIAFSPEVNVICGENAQGKTNLLEAVYFLCGVRSFRSRGDKELIRFGEEQARLRARFEAEGREQELELTLRRNGRRQILLNGRDMQSCAVEDLPVDDALAVRRNQALHGKADAEDLLVAELAVVLELQDAGTDRLKVSIRRLEVDGKDRAVNLPAVEVDGDDLDQVTQELHADADAILRLDSVGTRLAPDDFALDLPRFADEPFLLQGIEIRRDGRTAQMQVIGDILLCDAFLLIDVLINPLAVRLADFRRCDALLHHDPLFLQNDF